MPLYLKALRERKTTAEEQGNVLDSLPRLQTVIHHNFYFYS